MDLIEQYLDEKRLGLSPKSIKSYNTILRQYQRYLNKPIDQAERKDIIAYINSIADKGRSKNTQATAQRYIKSMYNYLYLNKIIVENPCSKLTNVKVDKRAPIYLTWDEWLRFFQVASINPRWKVVCRMLFATGIRISELIGIKKGDINFENKTIKVFGKGAKEREVIFDSATCDLLIEYTKNILPEDYVIDRASRTIENNIRDIAAMAELKKKITPHKLRHSFATQWLQNGGDVVALQKLLGHTSLNTTQIYTHYSTQELKNQYQNVHPLSNKAAST